LDSLRSQRSLRFRLLCLEILRITNLLPVLNAEYYEEITKNLNAENAEGRRDEGGGVFGFSAISAFSAF
jgi:hypothetical protein